MKSIVFAWFLVFMAGVNSCIGNLLLKRSRTNTCDSSLVSSFFSPWFLFGLFFYGVNVFLFAKSLDKLDVSVAYPALAGTGFALLAFTAKWIFKERMSLFQWIGIVLILAGILLISKK